jgi:hypothetical protein
MHQESDPKVNLQIQKRALLGGGGVENQVFQIVFHTTFVASFYSLYINTLAALLRWMYL